jgi:hypothetical protein
MSAYSNEIIAMSTENAVPEVRNLKQLLQYQEKAVVSRMLIKNPVGNVTLFAFDGNEGLSVSTGMQFFPLTGVQKFPVAQRTDA